MKTARDRRSVIAVAGTGARDRVQGDDHQQSVYSRLLLFMMTNDGSVDLLTCRSSSAQRAHAEPHHQAQRRGVHPFDAQRPPRMLFWLQKKQAPCT